MLALSRFDSPLAHAGSIAPTPRPVTVAYADRLFAAVDDAQQVFIGRNNQREPGDRLHTIALPEPARSICCIAMSCIVAGETGRIFHIRLQDEDRPTLEEITPHEPAMSLIIWNGSPAMIGSRGRFYESSYPYSSTLSFRMVRIPFRVRRAACFGASLLTLSADGALYTDWYAAMTSVYIPLPEPAYDIVSDPNHELTKHVRLADGSDRRPRYVKLTLGSEGITVDRTIAHQPFTSGVVRAISWTALPVPYIVGKRVVESVMVCRRKTSCGVICRTNDGHAYYAHYRRPTKEYGARMKVKALERLRKW